ncbi:MAG: preprotein translocase subunit SecY [Candidatus Raymondbacteria bacterium RifOxyA12_full_50_37]|uniref:Protein translocase subunit SecY n=1 Tax=Candidatus Raymondbacteria bacterium RIFOXYD12_FULL_49_13 TaxID=1817890 RepID=A0A1F7FD62_UNCRA|nr:MAG: preprotein translocase subunit SecY [Candidatus Raymondbacteria bacterium RifOxyA12_full_50_37]OGJ94074.1 MAG: preprotein translocase subunit SecY [Candidatus Raymondbacteria bacterium RIFOXYA2_FULL_49_16]OGJ96829.1 MAG: preprotein translocase subunit SecY [Candidatus Raymondbacteria bacterium RifOxyC12_full_50_8]OGJ96899.1 MAG: preprotein translocase subunit SecY [Candidatus Raymondbacteria bacterium RIFOXYC2_FULL_50_21]OGK01511.1 MAG: preprotein translocase subunit SecY [Candidatus Ra
MTDLLETFKNILKIPDLRRKIGYTLFILAIYRLGGHVPTPGIDPIALGEFFKESQNTLFGLYDMFAGGAFKRVTVFALGIMPYISASIILQLLGTVFPVLQKLQREGQEGRQKITQYTRYGTVLLSMVQAFGIAIFLENIQTRSGQGVVLFPGLGFKFLTMLILTTGTMFIMWLGEQINSKGIGNGISLIIFIGIVAQLPNAIFSEAQAFLTGTRSLVQEIVLLAIVFATVGFIVLVSQGIRKIPIQTPKRVIGRKVYGGQTSHLPLRVNTAGVIPVIFASSIMFAPNTLAQFLPNVEFAQNISLWFSPGAAMYNIFYGLLIIFFTYFYTAIIFNPVDIADNLKKNGGFIPGIRPGKHTAEFLDKILTRITLPGAIFLAFISIAPFALISVMNVSFFLGGTSVLIVVGVALDFIQQLESHLLMRHYDGFTKKGRIIGRRGY